MPLSTILAAFSSTELADIGNLVFALKQMIPAATTEVD